MVCGRTRRIAVERLVGWADVVVENFRTGVAKRLGLDYPTLVKSNPNLVYCSITGFGQTGPWRDKTAYDLVIQALSGALSVTGENGRPPAKMGLPLADEMASLFSGIAVLAALEKRERTGEGSYVDLSMFDVGLSMLSYMANIYFATGESPSAQGSAHPTIYLHSHYVRYTRTIYATRPLAAAHPYHLRHIPTIYSNPPQLVVN